MKRKAVIKPTQKYIVIGLLVVLFLSLYYLSFQKKKEGFFETNKYTRTDKNKSTEEILREKLENFKEKLENIKDEKNDLQKENQGLQKNIEKMQSKLNNAESLNKIAV